MEVLRPGVDLEAFWASLAAAPSRVLLLDYDGTLAPFRLERREAVPHPGVRERVRRLLETGRTRVVVVSGRAVEDLMPLLAVEPAPEIWGTHGWERRPVGGPVELAEMEPSARLGLQRARALVDAPGWEGRVEVKPASVAVHVRGLERGDAESASVRVEGLWKPLADEHGLEVHRFDGGVEARVPGRDKGTAVREILASEPEGAAVAYLGDDRTDEDAFRTLDGRGLRVLVRAEGRPTAADIRLTPPGELLDFLEAWAERSGT